MNAKPHSKLERKFLLYWRGLNGPDLVSEHKFHPNRKWRFDFAIPSIKFAIEIEGGIWSGGAHTRGRGYSQDCEKYNAATLLGWQVFRLTSNMIRVVDMQPIATDASIQVDDYNRTEKVKGVHHD